MLQLEYKSEVRFQKSEFCDEERNFHSNQMQPPGKVSKTLNRYIYPPGITYKNNLRRLFVVTIYQCANQDK